MTAEGTEARGHEGTKGTELDGRTISTYVECVERLIIGCANLIDRDTEDWNLRTARDLIKLTLFRAIGAHEFVNNAARLSGTGTGKPITRELLVELRSSIHRAFGAPGNFGYDHPIGQALSQLYALDLSGKGETS